MSVAYVREPALRAAVPFKNVVLANFVDTLDILGILVVTNKLVRVWVLVN